MQNYRVVGNLLGLVFGILSLALVPPLILSYVFNEPIHYQFYIPVIVFGLIGIVSLIRRKIVKRLSIRESIFIVFIVWVSFSVLGSLPYLLGNVFNTFTDAFFETLSGFTATGSTVLTDIESVPKSMLFWRSQTHWIGGMGIVVLAIAIFPVLQGKNMLFRSEAPVTVLEDKVLPRISVVAKSYWKIYILLTVAEILFLLPAMGWFDAVTHSFASVSGGGFSPRNDSIAYFDSVYVEIVIMAFMILGATSFILHFAALHGKPRYFKNTAFKIFISVIFFAGFLVAADLYMTPDLSYSFPGAMRDGFFQVVSIVTTTGFATADFKYWPDFSIIILLLLMFVGGMSSSTSGSVKIWRYEIIIKGIRRIFHRIINPRVVENIRFNDSVVSQNQVMQVQLFTLAYIFIFIISGLLLVALGYDAATSFSSAAATLGNVGPGIGGVGPFDNFAYLSGMAKWVLSVDMLIGRLEIWTVFIIFSPGFWKKL